MFTRGNSGPFGYVQDRLGMRKRIDFRRYEPIALVRGMGVDLAVPAAAWRAPAFLIEAARQLRIPPRDWPGILRFFKDVLTLRAGEVDRLEDVTVDALISTYTDNPKVLALFGLLLGLYFIIPFWEVSAGEAIYCFQRMVRANALGYPRGGSVAVPAAIVEGGRGHGLEVWTRAGVKRIEVAGDRVRAVVLEDGRDVETPVVVSTSSIKDTVLRLVGRERFPERYVSRVESVRGSFIAVQAKVALKRPLVKAGCVVGGLARADLPPEEAWSTGAFRDLFGEFERGRIPRVVPIYCPIPTSFDPSLAPPGHQLLTACALAPTTDVKLEDAPARWTEALLQALDQAVPGCRDEAVFVDTLSVEFMERWIGKTHGPAVSTGQRPDQVGRRRPPVRTPVRGLYIAGDGAGGRGVGTELACASGIEAALAISRDAEWRILD
jgi:prolycopene isomerase